MFDNSYKYVKTTKEVFDRYGQKFKCICGNDEFKIMYKDKSYLKYCTQCGMFCGFYKDIRRK